MRRKRLLWQLFPSYLLIALVSLVLITWYTSSSLHGFYISQIESELEARAKLSQNQFLEHLKPLNQEKINELCKFYEHNTKTRFTFILPDGKVIGDSSENPDKMENHLKRPEVAQAVHAVEGKAIRYSTTLNENMMYLTFPVIEDKKLVGIIRTAFPISSINDVLRVIYLKILFGGFIIAVIIALLSYTMSRKISLPLENLETGAKFFADGNLKYQLPIPDIKEIAGLAEAMNEMASQLDDRISAVEQKNNEQEAVFSNMAEGVIAVDADENIVEINRAAAKLLGVNISDVQGLKIDTVAHNSELLEFIKETLRSEKPVEDNIIFTRDKEYCLNVYGTQIRYARQHNIKAIVVLNDITKLRKLENIRRDFVANVSHELKTPITSIKGFVETLIDGAVEDREDAERFLKIVLKHANRLNAIIEDLLSLSRLEQGSNEEVRLERESIENVIKAVIQVCEVKAKLKDIRIEYFCEDDLYAYINPLLLEQAVANLVSNAINYSQDGNPVVVKAERSLSEIIISVQDYGCGIPEEHLSRIFERFYRVDKARSRKLGGTGLGLAIVKHITQIHNGYVGVESSPESGSTFSIHLPVWAEQNNNSIERWN